MPTPAWVTSLPGRDLGWGLDRAPHARPSVVLVLCWASAPLYKHSTGAALVFLLLY